MYAIAGISRAYPQTRKILIKRTPPSRAEYRRTRQSMAARADSSNHGPWKNPTWVFFRSGNPIV